MRNGLIFILGLIAAVGLSWAGIVLGSNGQLGGLAPFYDEAEGSSVPAWFPGVAAQGQLVYRGLGCAECHTQQVRRPDFGSDQARGWGDRQSVARDYIYQPFPQLGSSRVGPDLANLGGRKPNPPDEEDLMQLLYKGKGSMPAYRFLFTVREIVGQPSDRAVRITGEGAPPAGSEIVPSADAIALVGYLTNLNTNADYPESRPAPPAAGEEAPKTAPAKAGVANEQAAAKGQPTAQGHPAPTGPADSQPGAEGAKPQVGPSTAVSPDAQPMTSPAQKEPGK